MTTAAWAAYAAYGLTWVPICAPKSSTNDLPGPLSFSGGMPATLTYMPAAAGPLAVKSLNPSGAISG